jgi:formiminotetrahydrofolate cyclodeaminase
VTSVRTSVSDLRELSLEKLLDGLGGTEPGLGGGPAAALAAAMGAALVAAAARKSRDSWPEAVGVAAQAAALEARCVELAHADADAFAEALVALERGSDVEEPLREAVSVLLELGEASADVAALAALTAERCEGMFRGDAAAAAQLAAAATEVVATLVEVNLTVGPTDERLAWARRLVDSATRAARQAAESAR